MSDTTQQEPVEPSDGEDVVEGLSEETAKEETKEDTHES